jgi:hypothetical protein
MSFTDLTPVDSATLKAFLLELRGASNTFWYGDLTHTTPFNTVSGSLTIESASTARVINTTLDSASEVFSIGDYIQVGTDDSRELKMIIDVQSTGGLNYDLTIEPLMRRTDYVGLSLVYSSPKGKFRLTGDDLANWSSRGKAYLTDMNIEFVESF